MDEVNVIEVGVPEVPVVEVAAPLVLADDLPEDVPAVPEKIVRTDEIRAGDKARQAKSRAAKKERERITAYKYDSPHEPVKSEILDILRTRIHNEHVVSTCYALGLEAVKRLDLTANRFFWANGLQQTLKSQRGKGGEKLLEIEHGALVPSEVLHLGDLYSLWDLSVSFREPEVTFEDFIATRARVKSDALALGNEFLDKQFEIQPHGNWARFLPQFKPAGLKPNYSQADMGRWLGQMCSEEASDPSCRAYMLLASRNSFKSSFIHVLLITALLNCPSLRLLLCSQTNRLSKDFIRSWRSVFEISGEPTRFQYFHPEHCVERGDGSVTSFSSPARTLKNLAQDSVTITSAESDARAGLRYDIAVFDDIISDASTGNDEQTAKSIQVFDSLQKLRELNSNSGMSLVVGTPWVPNDLYQTLVNRNEAALPGEKSILIKLDPAFVVKPTARHLPILMLTEDMIESLSFPSRLTFKLLMKEARSNLNLMRSQHLLHWVSDDDTVKCSFTREQLDQAIRPSTAFRLAKRSFRVLAVDPSFSVSRFADYSCLCIIDFLENPNDRTGVLENIAFIRDIKLERMKTSDLAVAICDLAHTHRPTTPGGELRCMIEKSGDWQSLQEALQRAFLLRGRVLPAFYWKPTANIQGGASVLAKTNRIKQCLEPLLNEQKLFFGSSITCLEEVFHQFVKFDGVRRSGSTRKDDAPDCIAMALQTFYPRTIQPEAKPDEALLEYENQTRIAQHLAQQHERYFGGTSFAPHLQLDSRDLTQEQFTGLYQTLGRFGLAKNGRAA